jgi:hypothetical protein
MKDKCTLFNPMITQLVHRALETLCQHEGIQVVSIPTSSSFKMQEDVLYMWWIVP